MRLSEAATFLGGELVGDDLEFFSVSTDTRTLQAGDVYVALKGPRFNGHQHVAEARQKGAMALIVSEPVKDLQPKIQVKNTLLALGQLASAWMHQFNPVTVAVTGSCGKTSVKEMLMNILSRQGNTLATEGNFNNEIGVPLTMLRVEQDHQYAVVEMGANQLGEIAYTSGLVKPDVALITNAAAAHIEGFGSADNVAKAKGEIYSGLKESGTAVVNKDDRYAEFWLGLLDGRTVRTFSLCDSEADCYASALSVNELGQFSFTLHVDQKTTSIALSLLGRHNVINAVAAAAAANAAGASMAAIKSGLEKCRAIQGRLFPVKIGTLNVIDDTYNANPASIEAAADLLSEIKGVRCMVLGDMAELGTHATTLHANVGRYVAERGIDVLIAKGKHAADYFVGFTEKKAEGQRCFRYQEFAEVVEHLRSQLAGATVLLKGSRSTTMEKIIEMMSEDMSSAKDAN